MSFPAQNQPLPQNCTFSLCNVLLSWPSLNLHFLLNAKTLANPSPKGSFFFSLSLSLSPSLFFFLFLSLSKHRHRVIGVGRGEDQAVFNQIPWKSPVQIRLNSGRSPLKSCVRSWQGLKSKIRLSPSNPILRRTPLSRDRKLLVWTFCRANSSRKSPFKFFCPVTMPL